MKDMMRQFENLNSEFGGDAVLKNVSLKFRNKKFFNDFRHRIQTDRRGEVSFAVQRKNGKFIVIRTKVYPKGIYRIPTGGIDIGEDVLHALFREVREELGLEVEIRKFLGAVKYKITCGKETLEFFTFAFWLTELSGNILEDASEDEIGEYIEADKEKLMEISENLTKNSSNWQDWCSFRKQSTSFIIPYI